VIAKEVIEARGKVLIGLVLALLIAVGTTYAYSLIQDLLQRPETQSALATSGGSGAGLAALGTFDTYVWGNWYAKNGGLILGGLAAFLGAALVAGEVSKGSIFFLLSQPVSRDRVLLTKYAVNAGLLLGVGLLIAVALWITAALMGQALPVGGLLASTLLLWLGTLAILGAALLFSVLVPDALRAAGLAVVVAVLLGLPGVIGTFVPGWADWSLPNYWASLPAFQGTALPLKELAIDLVAAGLPLAAALLLFRRRAY
jgi:ABC-type transport system involved in multi-copper enzyme maturation permease subunit